MCAAVCGPNLRPPRDLLRVPPAHVPDFLGIVVIRLVGSVGEVNLSVRVVGLPDLAVL